jgi:sec-independent protein translocase protein TatB
MFDFAWSEIALIGVVALVLIGPKDMPVAVKAMANMVKKARRMAAEFQGHVDEMVRDTELADVRKQFNELRNFDIRGEVERAVDEDGSLRKTFADPLITPAPTVMPPAAEPAIEVEFGHAGNPAITVAAGPEPAAAEAAPPGVDPLAFLPPSVTQSPEVPAFIPPRIARSQGVRELRF